MQHAVDCGETYGAVNMQLAVGCDEFGVIFDHHPSLSEQTNASHTRLFVNSIPSILSIPRTHHISSCYTSRTKTKSANRLKQCECLSRKKKFPAPC